MELQNHSVSEEMWKLPENLKGPVLPRLHKGIDGFRKWQINLRNRLSVFRNITGKKLAKNRVTLENNQRKALLVRNQCERPTHTPTPPVPTGSLAVPPLPLRRAPHFSGWTVILCAKTQSQVFLNFFSFSVFMSNCLEDIWRVTWSRVLEDVF